MESVRPAQQPSGARVGITPDTALIRYLALQEGKRKALEENGGTCTRHHEIPEISASDINCFCIWARPDQRTLAVLQDVQSRLMSLVGPDMHLIPAEDLHLSVIELSHRHTVPFLRDVYAFVGAELLGQLLAVTSHPNHQPCLVRPLLMFDKVRVAVAFVPAATTQLHAPDVQQEVQSDVKRLNEEYTYHHLRTQLHTMLLTTGMAIDTCYTAPIAHITIGRFVDNRFFSPPRSPPSITESENVRMEQEQEHMQKWIASVSEVNMDLKERYWGNESREGKEEHFEWVVGSEKSLEVQLGYIKFGRPRERAEMVGPAPKYLHVHSHRSFLIPYSASTSATSTTFTRPSKAATAVPTIPRGTSLRRSSRTSSPSTLKERRVLPSVVDL